jgi:hypothetical protein
MKSRKLLGLPIVAVCLLLTWTQGAQAKDIEFEIFSLQDVKIIDSKDAEVQRRLAVFGRVATVTITERFDPDSRKPPQELLPMSLTLDANSKLKATVSNDAISLDVQIVMRGFDTVELRGYYNTAPAKSKAAQVVQVVMPKSPTIIVDPRSRRPCCCLFSFCRK